MLTARGGGGDTAAASRDSTAMETVNAAAAAIAAVQSRAPQATAVKVRTRAARLVRVSFPASISACWISEDFRFESGDGWRSAIVPIDSLWLCLFVHRVC